MKPIEKDVIKTSGNLTAIEEKVFGVAEDGLPHIYEMLSDIYSNPELAVLRELSANGLDSQIEAGYTGPVEVFLPNSLNPIVKFVDHGTGMSIDKLQEIYTNYGASTKRGTNTQVGMLGIGSKSPLAVTDSFTIVTVCDGVKTVGQISKNDHGVGVLRILDTCTTDEPSGTTIAIPVTNNIQKWRDEARELFQFWAPGSIVVDGREPDFIEGIRINDRITVLSKGSYNDYVVQGNIHYAVDNQYRLGEWPYSVLVNIPIGSVSFTPSRDALKYNTVTINFLKKLAGEIRNELAGFVRQDVANSADKGEALVKYWRWYNLGIKVDATFNGDEIPQDIKVEGYQLRRQWNGRYLREDISRIYLRGLGDEETLFVLNWDQGRPSTTFRKKMLLYMDSLSKKYRNVYFVPSDFDTSWTTGVDLVDKSDIDAIKLSPTAPSSRAGKGLGGAWKTIDNHGNEVIIDDLPDGVFYFSPKDRIEPWAITEFIRQTGAIVVEASTNRWPRIQRESNGSKPLTHTEIRNALKIEWDEDDIAYFKSRAIPDWVGRLNDADDPELKELIKYSHVNQTTANIRKSRSLGWYKTPEPDFNFSFLGARYPLTKSLYQHSLGDVLAIKHLELYVNTVYKSLEDSEEV